MMSDSRILKQLMAATIWLPLFLLSACKTTEDASLRDTLTSSSELDAVMRDNLFGLCVIIEDTAKTKGDETCHVEIIEGICSQQQNSIDDAIKSLVADDVVKNFIPADKQAQLDAHLRQDFKQAVDKCLNAQIYRNIAYNEQIANDPERQRTAKAGRIKFWKNMLMNALFPALYVQARVAAFAEVKRATPVKMVVKNRTLTAATPTFIKQMAIGVMCQAGASAAAWFINENKPDLTRSECSKVTTFDGARMRACFRTIGSACMAGAGFLNFQAIPGVTTESEAINFVNDIGALGLETMCRLGGPLSAAACGTINAAAAQIVTAWQTGTNDWAECTVNPLARCLGEWWGKGTWTNDNGVESPRVVTSRHGDKWWIKGCCLCRRDWRERRSFATDPTTRKEWELGVIQAGDFNSGNCAEQQRKTWNVDSTTYYTYSNCQRVEVVGGRCALQYIDDYSRTTDVTQWLWDASLRDVNRRVSRTRGIH